MELEQVLPAWTFYAHHGLYSREQQVGQRFELSLRLGLHPKDGLSGEGTKGMLDYAVLRQEVAAYLVQVPPVQLLEQLAYRLACHLLRTYPQLLKIDLHLSKPEARGLDPEEVSFVVGVRLAMARDELPADEDS